MWTQHQLRQTAGARRSLTGTSGTSPINRHLYTVSLNQRRCVLRGCIILAQCTVYLVGRKSTQGSPPECVFFANRGSQHKLQVIFQTHLRSTHNIMQTQQQLRQAPGTRRSIDGHESRRPHKSTSVPIESKSTAQCGTWLHYLGAMQCIPHGSGEHSSQFSQMVSFLPTPDCGSLHNIHVIKTALANHSQQHVDTTTVSPNTRGVSHY